MGTVTLPSHYRYTFITLPLQEHGDPVGTVAVRVLRAKGLMAADKGGKSDPYVVMQSTNGAKAKPGL